MAQTQLDPDALAQLVVNAILGDGFCRATFSGVVRSVSPWLRIVVRPVRLRGERHLQFSYFDRTKDITKNYALNEAAEQLREVVAMSYSGIHISTQAEQIDIRTTKKGKILVGRSKATDTSPPAEEHNRRKQAPLPEGQADHFLEVLGVLDRNGQVRPTMRAKFTQINEFLKHLAQVVTDAHLSSLDRELQILDCGCGASYLTLAARHYLNEVLQIPARLIGVDVNEDLIRKSAERTERLAAEGIAFACGPIASVDVRPDIVLALHACDTATDDAIAQAVHADAAALLCVPCCHKELNARLRAEGETQSLRPLFRHGILWQRNADLVTDAFRALVLRIMGYRTEVVEFVSSEHTARNLMIRAVRGPAVGESAFVREYVEMRRFWGVSPYIERALGEPFAKFLS